MFHIDPSRSTLPISRLNTVRAMIGKAIPWPIAQGPDKGVLRDVVNDTAVTGVCPDPPTTDWELQGSYWHEGECICVYTLIGDPSQILERPCN